MENKNSLLLKVTLTACQGVEYVWNNEGREAGGHTLHYTACKQSSHLSIILYQCWQKHDTFPHLWKDYLCELLKNIEKDR